MKNPLKILVGAASRLFGESTLAGWLAGLAAAIAGSRSSQGALRFLLDLDNRLYGLQGQQAVRLGEGVHAKHRLTGYHDFFVGRIAPGATVLDVGCCKGTVARDLAERAGAVVTGIDINAEQIAAARRLAGGSLVRFIHGDALTDLPAEHFDVVILSNVLEHLDDRSAFLRRLQARLTPGRILVRVPLFERDWRVPLKRELGVEWRLDPTHCTEYTLESFRQEVEAAELDVVHLEVRWGEIWCELRAVPE